PRKTERDRIVKKRQGNEEEGFVPFLQKVGGDFIVVQSLADHFVEPLADRQDPALLGGGEIDDDPVLLVEDKEIVKPFDLAVRIEMDLVLSELLDKVPDLGLFVLG